MKKRILPALLALVMVLGMLPLAAFADADEGGGEAAAPAKVVNYGFVWDASSLTKGGTIAGTGATVGNDWMNETMYIVTDRAIGVGTYVWIKVTIGGEEWGCYAGNSDTATTYAFSFLNRAGQWEQMPESVKSETTHAEKYLESKITDESLSMTLQVYSGVTYTAGTAPTDLPSKASFTRSITLKKNEEIKTYNGYTAAEWIADMNSALSGLNSAITGENGSKVLTLTDTLTAKPNGSFLNVWANKDYYQAAQQVGSDAEKTQAGTIKTTLEGIKKIDASGLSNNKLIGMGTLSPYTKLEELNFRGNTVSANNVLDGAEMASWKETLTKLNLSNTGVSDVSVLYEFTKLVELDLSGNTGLTEKTNEQSQVINGITALAYCTELTTLDISNTGIKNLNALANLTKLTSLKATNLQNVNLLGLVALVNKESFNVSSLGDGAFVFTDSTKDNTLTKAEKIAVNKMIDDLGSKATGLTKYDIEDDTPEINVAAANLTGWSEGKPQGENADTYTVTETGGTITVNATGLKKHNNANGQEGYWVGVALTKLDNATYSWKFKDGEAGTKTTQQLVDAGRVQTVGDDTYVTLYWSTDNTTTPWSETEGEVTVTVGDTTITYNVTFSVTVAEEAPVAKDIDITYTNFKEPLKHLANGYFTIVNDTGSTDITSGKDYLVQIVHSGVASIFVVTADENGLEFLCNFKAGDQLGVWELADGTDVKTATASSLAGSCLVFQELDSRFIKTQQ